MSFHTSPLLMAARRASGWSIATVAIATATLSGCTPNPSPSASAPSASVDAASSAEEFTIVTTTLAVTNFTKAVVGDRAEVIYLLPTNVGPHDYQARPEDVRTLAEADVLVKNGLELETYLEPLIDNANNTDLVVIDSSDAIPTLSNAELEEAAVTVQGQADPDHGHDHAADAAHPEADQAAEHIEEDGHHHAGEYNPHIWLDPRRAIQQVETIRDGLIAADPQGTSTYTANAAAYIEQLNALDQDIATALKPYAGQTFVTYHDFAPYFAERYGLAVQYMVGVPEENPSPEDVRRVLDITRASGLKTLLTEPQAGANSFEALARDLEVQISTFDPTMKP